MGHCACGPGAPRFGQFWPGSNAMNESSHNILLAFVDWVENKVAPDTIVGTSEEGAETRIHCRYPMQSVWDGGKFGCMPGGT
ncbi:hypothetical protein B0H16DRAFT_1590182 [Mycena metata]|uniref:Carboxylic ester hydrolase n=1 Tax=Mycena metata TaxID=1033252 RepID=A0AAD7MRL8_9AGAR|nr:hypothetical protein B0H16DRAFT_1590182 [Mycena metata]